MNRVLTTIYKFGLAECGNRVKIYRGFSCRKPNCIFLEDSVLIDRNCEFVTEGINPIIIRKGTTIGRNCRIDFTGGIVIDEMSHLSEGVKIITHDHGYNFNTIPIGKSLVIGKNVFIGMNSIILHNVAKIGDNSVIGIGSIVTKDIPPNVIVAGNPATFLKNKEDISRNFFCSDFKEQH